MKQFVCGDVVPGCTARFEAGSEEEIFAAVAHHAASVHGMQEIPPSLVATVRTLIRDVPTA